MTATEGDPPVWEWRCFLGSAQVCCASRAGCEVLIGRSLDGAFISLCMSEFPSEVTRPERQRELCPQSCTFHRGVITGAPYTHHGRASVRVLYRYTGEFGFA